MPLQPCGQIQLVRNSRQSSARCDDQRRPLWKAEGYHNCGTASCKERSNTEKDKEPESPLRLALSPAQELLHAAVDVILGAETAALLNIGGGAGLCHAAPE